MGLKSVSPGPFLVWYVFLVLLISFPAYAGLKAVSNPNPLPTANGGTGQANSLFSPDTYYTSGDDTASIQAAINAAVALPCGTVVLKNKRYVITSALTISGCANIAGVSSAYTGSDVIPFTYPYINGTVIEQDTAATDVIDITAIAVPVNLANFGFTFGESIIFSNTGHGINSTPPALNTALNQGILYSDWHNIMGFGQDGNHYAFVISNFEYNSANNLFSLGGGAYDFVNFTNNANYTGGFVAEQNGNSQINNLFATFFVNGTAHCINFNNNTSVDASSFSNLYVFGRLQCNRTAVGSIHGHTITAPGNSQLIVNSNGNLPNLLILQPDFEPTTGNYINLEKNTTGSWHEDISGVLGLSLNDSNFGVAVQPYEAGTNGTYGQRRHYTDLSTRLTAMESSGTAFAIVQDSGLRGPAYATDGTGTTIFPDVIQPLAGPSGLRWSTYVPAGIGAWFFDTTLGKPAYYNGSGWVDGAGTSLTVPAAGATSATDTFSVTVSSLTNPSYSSTGGQKWYCNTNNGNINFSTNGTYARSTVSNGNAENGCWLYTHNYNGTLSATLAVVNNPRLIFRLSDRNNYWEVQTTGLYKIVNGSQQAASATWSAVTAGATISVILSGSSITVKNAGSTIGTATDAFNSTATGYGIAVYQDTTSEFESFLVVNP